jgi:hypothetical protein
MHDFLLLTCIASAFALNRWILCLFSCGCTHLFLMVQGAGLPLALVLRAGHFALRVLLKSWMIQILTAFVLD